MSIKQRAEIIEQSAGCPRCTSWAHCKAQCSMQAIDCKEVVNGSQCHRDHSRLVCNSGVAYCLSAKTGSGDVDLYQPTLHYLQDIHINNDVETARILWDNGSNRVLVDHSFAAERKLRSRSTTVTMKVVGGQFKKVRTKIYEVDLVDKSGQKHSIWGFGIDLIIEPDDPVDVSAVRSLFPHIPDEVFSTLPKKRVDILVGLNFNSLHPYGGLGQNAVGDLKVLHSRFGNGWVLGGCHESLKMFPIRMTSEAIAARIARVSIIPSIDVINLEEKTITPAFAKVSIDPPLTPEFWQSDNMGILPPRHCTRCRQCALKGECSESHIQLSLKEEAELKLIQENIKIIDGQVHVSYPFIKNPYCLSHNRSVVVKIASKLWQSLKKDSLLDTYNEEIKKYVARGTFVRLSKEEIESYEGPHNWITHHAVLKNSKTTPCRVVTNSSFDNGGHSLNSCLPKGPNSLNDMLAITLRFRCHEISFMYDLSKAYNSMRTGMIERHLRRFVWRYSEDEDWQDFAIDRVHFGDQSAACQLEVSKQLVANLGKDISEHASRIIKEDTYVDDGASGGSCSEIKSLIGVKDENGLYTGTIAKIFSLGGFIIKEFIVEGNLEQPAENTLGNSLFGYTWDTQKALLKVKLSINMSKKVRSVRSKPDLTLADISSLKDIKMTKRLLLGIANAFGDFLGIACPFTVRLKILMKKLYEQETPLSWDDDVPVALRPAWIEIISEALTHTELSFPRSTRPMDAEGGPKVVAFGDGAFAAFAAAIYLVWKRKCKEDCGFNCSGHFSSSLLCAKSRVTPLNGYTIPRSEISGAVLASRLLLSTVKALSCLKEPPEGAVLLLDSECTISSLEMSAKKLKPFFHNRRGELLENMALVNDICPMEQVHHVGGTLNPADIATRGNTKLEDIGLGSLWQTGPTFLCSPRSAWPVTREFVRVKLPDSEVRLPCDIIAAALRTKLPQQRLSEVALDDLPITHQVITQILNHNNSIESRKRVLALVFRGWKIGKTKEVLSLPITRDELVHAEKIIIATGMFETCEAFHRGDLESLLPEKKGCLIVTRGRLGESSLFRVFGVDALPILLPNTRAAELIMWRAHVGYCGILHRSVAHTLARSRNCAWIIRAKNLAKRVCFQCMYCRIERKKLSSQQMALFKEESIQVCKPWTNISLDFAGPVSIKGDVNVRSRSKSWILVIVCRNTKAVCLLATSGYSTADFLCKWEEFVARKGNPKTVVSDRGSQLVRAGMVLASKEKPENWEWANIVRNNCATNWHFVAVGSQHRNGLSESMVKIMKKSLHSAITPGTVLRYSELVTLLAKIAYAINSRPIGLSSISEDNQQVDFISPITPNQLLLGMSDETAPPMEYDESDNLTARLAYVSEVFRCWWKTWYLQVLPSLVPCRKWKKEQRNLQKGDIVFVYYPSSIQGDYRLAKIIDIFPDEKGLVRTVRIAYRKRDKREKALSYKSKPLENEIVSVQRLSVLLPVSEQGVNIVNSSA